MVGKAPTMNGEGKLAPLGRVASLHVHPLKGGQPMLTVSHFEVVEGKGIQGNERYFGRISRMTGGPSARQVTLIAREQIAAHAEKLGLSGIPPGAVRANIETSGIDLLALLGQFVLIGSAVLCIRDPRTPCAKMDAIAPGLRALMGNRQQGVLAEVICSGLISNGDALVLVHQSELKQTLP